jgi:parallel beta-helix repeat protein
MKRFRLAIAAPAALATVAIGMGAAAQPAAAADLTITSDTTLTADHQGSIVIGADGITLDCDGHSIVGPGFAGVDLHFVTGTTVKNCNVSGFKVGFFVWSSPKNTLSDNTSNGNESEGFAIASSPNNEGNVLTGNLSSYNGWWGFAVYDGTTDTTLANNTARSNSLAGFLLSPGSVRTQVIENVAQENALSGFNIDSDANTVAGNTATENSENGFQVFQASGNAFAGNTSRGNRNGSGFAIAGSDLHDSSDNSFTGNIALSNRYDGFFFGDGASSNRLRGNVASDNGSHGFAFSSVSDILSGYDHATGNGEVGFSLDTCGASSFSHDVALDNEHGFVALASTGSLFSQDVANHNQGFGFELYGGSSGNTVTRSVAHANPFADAADFDPPSANTWVDNSFGTTFLP